MVTEVGATLRSYTLADEPVLDGFGADEWSHDGRGQVLAPWPNRLGDGRYQFAGLRAQAPLNEPELGNAIHGLVRWVPWQVEAHAQNVVVLTCQLYPSPGYPFRARLRLEYRVGRAGLSVTTSAANLGDGALPFGVGFHPYLTAGTETADAAVLRLPATHRLVTDDRLLPTGETRPVMGTEYDFTGGRALGPTRLDTAYTGLVRDPDGRARASLDDPRGGRGVELWVDEGFEYLMCYTGDTLADPQRRRRAVALEPMSCPPDAFRSGVDVIRLESDQVWEAAWGLHPR